MIELEGRGFALLAEVLSFIADCRDTQETIRCAQAGHRRQI